MGTGYGVQVAGATGLIMGVTTQDKALSLVNMINSEYADHPATLVIEGVFVNPKQDEVRNVLDAIARANPRLGLRRIKPRKEDMQ